MVEIINRKQIGTCNHCDTCFAYEDSDRTAQKGGDFLQIMGEDMGEDTGISFETIQLCVICPACKGKVIVWESEKRIKYE